MDEGRLWYVKRVSKLRDKCSTAVNDKIKDRLRVLTDSLDKNKKAYSFRHDQNCHGLKWSYTRGRGLQQCLEEVRKKDESGTIHLPTFGQYDGAPLDSFRKEVDRLIASNHPKERRQRKIQDIKNNLENCGILTDYSHMTSKLENILENPSRHKIELSGVSPRKNRRHVKLRKRPPVIQRPQIHLPPITASRKDFICIHDDKLQPLPASIPNINHSRSSTLLSF